MDVFNKKVLKAKEARILELEALLITKGKHCQQQTALIKSLEKKLKEKL